MNEETNKLIQQLAEKLGTTTEHLWTVLIKQAPISALVDTICFIASIIGILVACKTMAKIIKKVDDSYEEWPLFVSIVNAAVIFVGCCVVVYVISNFSLIVAGFFNPEYWALRQIVKAP